MPIQMQCPQCRAVAALPDGHAGRPVRCKRCKASFSVPPDAGANPDQPTTIDRYLVRELLGEGSFGSVYRAFDPRLERDVALKVLRPQMMTSAHAVERFLRESKAAAKLLHPNIVPVYDAGRSGSIYYIASAFIKGMTLASAVPEEGGMDPRRAATLTAQLAAALGYAHKQGILHRDVKPANAMLNEQDSLHLMDFGLAGWTQEESTRLTRLGAVMGTPAYMAPEQASGDTKNVGPAADLYGAGVVLYELLTSRHPFEGGHPTALAYQIIHAAPTPPSQHKPDLDASLEAICLKAMAKKPQDRFASGEEMAAALMQWTPAVIPVTTPTPVAWPVKPTESPVVGSMAAVEPLASASPKQTILPSSGRAAARLPSVFDRETVMPASAKRSTLGSPPPARTQGGSWQRLDPDTRRNVMLGGTVLLAVAGVLLLVMLIWLSSPKPPTNTEQANNGEKRHTEQSVESQPDVRAQTDISPAPPPVNPPPITVDPPVTVDLPVVPPTVKGLPVTPAVGTTQPQPPPEEKLADEIINSIGMKLKLIKPGTFLMGSPKDEKGRIDSEGPQHEVELSRPFYLGVYPVTVGQFAAFVKDADYKTEVETDGRGGRGYNAATRTFENSLKYTWRNPSFMQTNAHPVVNVSWNDAVKFCEWLSRKEKKTYGLPTEAQWEYACRAGTTTVYSFGDDPQMLGDYSWYWNNSGLQTHPVGGKKPNRWGLYDMQGNVWQWCADYYDDKYYQNSPNKDPQNILQTNVRVLRGGSWNDVAEYCRAAYRGRIAPGGRGYDLGLRVCFRLD